MPRLSWLFALLVVSQTVSLPAEAAPQATIQSGWPSYMRLNSDACNYFPGDALTLTVVDHGKPIANSPFCSTDGRASAHVVTDKSGKIFVLEEYSEGHGAGQAVVNYLEIDRLQHSEFLEVLRLPLSWATGVDQRFTYSYEIEFPASGGIRIHLRGKNLGHAGPPDLDCCVPDTRNRTIDISQ
jgi:hypothetical protein